jgi:phosphoribosylglycinamide formyltransferase 1
MSIVKIGVLLSGSGSNFQQIINQVEAGTINGEIVVAISNKKEAYGLERASQKNIPCLFIDATKYSDDEYHECLLAELESKGVELVVLAGYIKILNKKFIDKYRHKIINIHPSLIPSFCGKKYYGIKVHQAAIAYGVKVSGATVHFVDEEADHGPIIIQKVVEVIDQDTPESLAKRILSVEHEILPEAVRLYCEGRLVIEGRKVIIR